METLYMPDRNLNYEAITQDIPNWLVEHINDAKADGLVVGVSGGIDSGVVSTLAAKTGKEVLAVSMPIHQNEKQVDTAGAHIEWLKNNFSNVTSEVLDLSNIYDLFRKTLEQVEGKTPERSDLANVNLRSRIRANTLYDIAGKRNLLVAGTGNRVEDMGIGFFTKYGDGAFDLSPIGELYKSEVYKLGRYNKLIDDILNAVPTDGLWENGATDEEQIGAIYDELEWAMVEYENGKRYFEGRAKEVMDIYSGRHERNAHKMKMPPVFRVEG